MPPRSGQSADIALTGRAQRAPTCADDQKNGLGIQRGHPRSHRINFGALLQRV